MKIVKQQGSALIVSLIMLTSVTFLAILSLQGSTTQIRIVSNLQIKEDMFHSTTREQNHQYSKAVNDPKTLDDMFEAIQQTDPVTLDQIVNFTDKAVSSEVEYIGTIPPGLNYTTVDESTAGSITPYPFLITTNGVDQAQKIGAAMIQGYTYNMPSNGR
ncbi:MAG: Tfp pilus assembly protein PilX [Marinomonas primoryensis]|jgi:Tfp pilus assembly protein PilX